MFGSGEIIFEVGNLSGIVLRFRFGVGFEVSVSLFDGTLVCGHFVGRIFKWFTITIAALKCLDGLSCVMGLIVDEESLHNTLGDVPFPGFVLSCLSGVGLFFFCFILLRCGRVRCWFCCGFVGCGCLFLMLVLCWSLGVSSLCA